MLLAPCLESIGTAVEPMEESLVELHPIGEIEVGADAAHIVEPVEGIQQLQAAAGGVGIVHSDAGLGGPVMTPFPHIPVSPS